MLCEKCKSSLSAIDKADYILEQLDENFLKKYNAVMKSMRFVEYYENQTT